jgi:hypothetical protein
MPAKNNRQSILPILMVIGGVILILGAAAWLIQSSRQTAALEKDLPPPVSSPRIPYPDMKRISLGDAKAAYELKQAVFVDVRGDPYFSQGHIPGAVSMSDNDLPARLAELDPQAWIITYCT